jgi:hypothetical protein
MINLVHKSTPPLAARVRRQRDQRNRFNSRVALQILWQDEVSGGEG